MPMPLGRQAQACCSSATALGLHFDLAATTTIAGKGKSRTASRHDDNARDAQEAAQDGFDTESFERCSGILHSAVCIGLLIWALYLLNVFQPSFMLLFGTRCNARGGGGFVRI
jgi:hypothetical protein